MYVGLTKNIMFIVLKEHVTWDINVTHLGLIFGQQLRCMAERKKIHQASAAQAILVDRIESVLVLVLS